MKAKLIYFTALLFIAFGSKAQNYDSFFGINETHVVRISKDDVVIDSQYSMDSLAITSETITSDNKTLKVVEYFRTNQDQHQDFELTFYLRENVEQGKLWFRNSIEGDELLIADLSMVIGDTPNDILGLLNQSVSEVNFEDGDKIIKFSQPIFVAPNEGITDQFMFFKEGVFPNLLGPF